MYFSVAAPPVDITEVLQQAKAASAVATAAAEGAPSAISPSAGVPLASTRAAVVSGVTFEVPAA